MSEGKAGVPIEPVRRSVTVSWNVASAFQRFTAQIASWWPLRSHSVSGEQAVSCVFEQHVGGKIYEVARDGARSEWGTVLVWDPPGRVEFTWHPGSGPEVASRVELRFSAVAGGTRLDLTHTGWEVFGRNAQKMRRGYNVGWVYVLNL
ncbi:MAG: SRPBCC domain-containing protein, partial [Longimicrobiales bacterium]